MLNGLPRPRADLDSEPFWAGCREGRLLIPRCGDCGAARWPPGPMCPACQSQETAWEPASGRGTVYSWVVVTHPVDEALIDQVPYAVGLIELEEGVRLVGNVAGIDPSDIVAGLPVTAYFEPPDAEGRRLPNFRVADPAAR